ncbi:MAG: GFA family protein [Acidithiobacillus sp.]
MKLEIFHKNIESTADSGRKVSRGFCPKCGSQLFAKLEMLPDIIGLALVL